MILSSPHTFLSRMVAAGLIVSLGVASLAPTFAHAQALAQVGAQEKALAPETHPLGDIPDSQQFVVYAASQGASVKVPEGWARKDTPDGAVFSDKYGQITLAIRPFAGPLTVASVRADQVAQLEKTGRAVKVVRVEKVKLPAGTAVRVVYTENSDPNPVTNKQVRLESELTLLTHGGKLAALTFSAPQGADNVDQWRLMSRSFAWK